MKDIMIVLGFVALIVVLVLSPFLTIWALNTLFPVLAIPYSMQTYFAALIVNGLIGSTRISRD